MSEMHYLDFDLLIERSPSGSGYRARVLSSPAGRAAAEFELPFSDLEIENFFLRVGRTSRSKVQPIFSSFQPSSRMRTWAPSMPTPIR